MPIKITWEATCDLCGETTTVTSAGNVPVDPVMTPFYGGCHTEFGWVCEEPACQLQLKLHRIVTSFIEAVRRRRG